jgi:hypothetical protein
MTRFLLAVLLILGGSNAAAFSLSMMGNSGGESLSLFDQFGSRRSFAASSCTTIAGVTSILTSRTQPSNAAAAAATVKEIITTPTGIKYAITKEPADSKKAVVPYKGERPFSRNAYFLRIVVAWS